MKTSTHTHAHVLEDECCCHHCLTSAVIQSPPKDPCFAKTRVLPNMTFMRASLTNTSLKYALQEQTVLAIANLTGH